VYLYFNNNWSNFHDFLIIGFEYMIFQSWGISSPLWSIWLGRGPKMWVVSFPIRGDILGPL